MQLNSKALEALHAFVETGSLSQAAERIRRSPPQVSRLLSSIESQVGFKVLLRRGRRLVLSKEGRDLFNEVERLISVQGDVERRADQIRQGQNKHIRILTAPFISHAAVNQSLAHVMKKHPDLTAQVESRVRLDIDTWVVQETFDLGVASLPIKSGAFDIDPFLELPIVAVMHEDHPLAKCKIVHWEDFIKHGIILTHRRSLLGQHLEPLFKKTDQNINVRVRARNGVIACQMAGLNIGCCIADPLVALSCGANNIVIRPFEPIGILKYGFIYPSWGNQTEIVEEVSNEIRRRTADLASKIYDNNIFNYLKNSL